MDAGRFGHFLPLFCISSAVSGQIVTKMGMEIPLGSESVIGKSDLQNSKRLSWKSGYFLKGKYVGTLNIAFPDLYFLALL